MFIGLIYGADISARIGFKSTSDTVALIVFVFFAVYLVFLPSISTVVDVIECCRRSDTLYLIKIHICIWRLDYYPLSNSFCCLAGFAFLGPSETDF